MVTTNKSIALTAGTAAATPSTASARAISAVVTGPASLSAQPDGSATGNFASVLDQLGQPSADSPKLDASAKPPAAMLNPTNSQFQSAVPNQPTANLLASDQTAPTSRPLSAALASQVKSGAGTDSDASKTTEPDDSADGNEPGTLTVVAATVLIPTPAVVVTPTAPVPAVTLSQSRDATSSNGDPTASVTPAALQIANETGPTTNPSEKPTTALVAAQAAATPQTARSSARTNGDGPADAAPATRSKTVIAKTDQPSTENSVLPTIKAALPVIMAGNPALTLPATIPTAVALAGQPTPIQPGATSTQAPRTARSASEPTPASAQIAASFTTPVPDVLASGSPATAITAPTPTPGTALTSPATTSVTKPLQQNPLPNSPATQVAQAIIEPVKVLMSSSAQATSTASHITTIQITPIELGRVEIRIERTVDGLAKIQLVAERPETLSRLVHDQSHLQQALDQAGVPQSGRTVDFSLAPAPTLDAGATPSYAGGSATGGSSTENEQQRQSGTYANRAFSAATETALTPTNQLRSMRTGIDITA